jgi:hypothetical protein
MAETVQNGSVRSANLVRAVQIARETPVRRSANGVQFATFGETGLGELDLDHMLEAVPSAVAAALEGNTYYFVPLALRASASADAATDATDAADTTNNTTNDLSSDARSDSAMIAPAWSDELGEAAICHRNVDLPQGRRGVFISTRLMNDRFALCFEFFINVAHAYVDRAGVPAAFGELVWQQALAKVRGETSLDAWEARNLAFGRTANAAPEPDPAIASRKPSRFETRMAARLSAGATTLPATGADAGTTTRQLPGRSLQAAADAAAPVAAAQPIDERERGLYLEYAFSDALAIYLLSIALDFHYSELREREYPLLAPQALAERLRWVAAMFPPNHGYEFAIRYRRRA